MVTQETLALSLSSLQFRLSSAFQSQLPSESSASLKLCKCKMEYEVLILDALNFFFVLNGCKGNLFVSSPSFALLESARIV